MMTAAKLKELLNANANEVVLYGYTHWMGNEGSKTVVVLFDEDDNLLRVTEWGRGKPTVEMSKYARPYFWGGVKRFYADATNDKFREFYEAFAGIMNDTPGGVAHKGEKYFIDPNPKNSIIINLDE